MADLRDLGLSKYEARAYRSLLQTGPTTAKELSQASGVPMGRIYDVLNGLEQHGLVRSQTAGRPTKYAAVEPDTALGRLLESKRDELRTRIDQYEAAVEELTADLEATAPIDGEFWTAAVGTEASIDLLVERLAAAEQSLVVVAGGVSPQFDFGTVGERVAAELEAAVDRGVDVSVLMEPDLVESLPVGVGGPYTERLAEHGAFAARTAPELSGTFELIDDTEVCIEVPNPLDPEEAFAVIDLKDPDFAANVRRMFDPKWEAADPLPLSSLAAE